MDLCYCFSMLAFDQSTPCQVTLLWKGTSSCCCVGSLPRTGHRPRLTVLRCCFQVLLVWLFCQSEFGSVENSGDIGTINQVRIKVLFFIIGGYTLGSADAGISDEVVVSDDDGAGWTDDTDVVFIKSASDLCSSRLFVAAEHLESASTKAFWLLWSVQNCLQVILSFQLLNSSRRRSLFSGGIWLSRMALYNVWYMNYNDKPLCRYHMYSMPATKPNSKNCISQINYINKSLSFLSQLVL